jgi:uncharacterized DUF497 family protein
VTDIRFEWDEAKNRSNQRKHGVSFQLAMRVFDDPLRASRLERIVDGEERWQTIGMADGRLLLMVIHLVFEEQMDGNWFEWIRIISARYAEPWERKHYEAGSG